MEESILLVDDEAALLAIMERTLAKRFSVFTAPDGPAGLEQLQLHGPFAVVVSDMRMPGMSGLQFLQETKRLSPDTVRLMCSGDGDLQTAVQAVNDGEVFRFVTKPFTPLGLQTIVAASVAQYRLVTAERTLLERTLNGLTQVLTDVLALVNPLASDCTARLRPCATHIAKVVAPEMMWQVDLAAMLSQLGCITVAPELLQHAYGSDWLDANDATRIASHPRVAYELLARIPRLEVVAEIILGQHTRRHQAAEETTPLATRDRAVLGAQILRVALEFDRLLTRGETREAAMATLEWQTEAFDTALVRALHSFAPASTVFEVKRMPLHQLAVGMILEEDLLTRYGVLLAPKRCTISPPMLHRLHDGQKTGNLPDDVLVRAVRARSRAGP